MTKRAICPACERPLATCLCAYLTPVVAPLDVLILQDPKEAKHALSSAPIIEKSLINCQRVIGEQFEPAQLLGPDWQDTALLLFPSEQASDIKPGMDINNKTLIVLDGTWKKAARLMHLNPWLSEIAHIRIAAQNESQYKIRKSPRSDGLSSIEATVAVLNSLSQSQDYDVILPAFEKMIDYQIQAMGAETYNKNYR